MLERAIEITARSHAGQRDKAGAPYILHPLRLMFRVSSDQARIAAVLHDVIEDSDTTVESLRAEGFTSGVLDAVECLTRRKGESYDNFIGRVARNPLAREVKDLRDNLDLARLGKPSESDRQRCEKYAKALKSLGAN